jgi:hypothetical protein
MGSFTRNAVVLVLASAWQLAEAQEANISLTPLGCQMYATWSGNLVWASDLDADKEKAKAELVRLDQHTPSSIYALMLRNLDSLWDTNADWEQVTMVVFKDCLARHGMYQSGQ